MVTGTVTSLRRGGSAAAMAQNEQMAEEHSTLKQQSLGRSYTWALSCNVLIHETGCLLVLNK